MTMTQITTIEQAITHRPHERWPRSQGGGPCECADCTAARRLRSEAAEETRREAVRRGLSRSIADRAASYRLGHGMTVERAIRQAVGWVRCERCGLEVERDNEYATGPGPRCGCDLRVRQ